MTPALLSAPRGRVLDEPSEVDALLTFVAAPPRDAYTYVFAPPEGTPAENCRPDPRMVRVANARCFDLAPSLDVEGFAAVGCATSVADFDDAETVQRRYYPEVRDLVMQACGAREVIVFDHLVRKRAAGTRAFSALGRGAGQDEHAGPAGRVHNDYTAASGITRLNRVLGRPEGTPFAGRFAIVNVWRSARGPILDAPLALCDARSVAAVDLVDTQIRYPHRTGAIYQVAHNAAQRWSYVHELQAGEAIVFKQFDSDARQPRFTPHGAFRHPGTPAGTPPRESVEARCLVLFEDFP